jgi:hypothetical protein
MKYWEIIAHNLSKVGWSLGWVSALDCAGRTMWIAERTSQRRKRFIVRADELLTAFMELEAAVRKFIAGFPGTPHNPRADTCLE